MVTVKASKSALRDDWVVAEVDPGQTIRQIVGDVPIHAWDESGKELSASFIDNTIIAEGSSITVRPVPQDANIFKMILMVAVVVIATVVSHGALSPYAGSMLASGSIGAYAAGAGILIAGTLLVNTLIPPPAPQGGDSSSSFNRLASLTGSSNQVASFVPIPRIYGTFRLFPPIPMTGRPYTELLGNDQYFRMLLVLGYGPLDIGGVTVGKGYSIIDETTSLSGIPIKIGDTDIHSFDNVEMEIGHWDQMSLFTKEIIETNPAWTTSHDVSSIPIDAGAQWLSDGQSTIRTTDTDAEEISIDVTGQLYCVNKKGKTKNSAVRFKIEYSPAGAGTWTTLYPSWQYYTPQPYWEVWSTRRETIRKGFRWKVPKGQYDVRLTRLSTYHESFSVATNQMVWSSLRTIRSDQPFTVDGMVCMALRIKATDQLNGRLDSVNIETSSVLPVFGQSSSTTDIVNGDVMTLHNSPTWISGREGGGISWDGASSTWGQVPHNTVYDPGAGDFSYEFWVRGDIMASGEAYPRIMDKNGGTGVSSGWGIWGRSTAGVPIAWGPRFDDTTLAIVSVFTEAQTVFSDWTHFAVVLDRGNNLLSFYKNGEVSGTADITGFGTVSSTVDLLVAAATLGSSQWMTADLDDIRFWSTARTQTEIKENMHVTLTGSETGLLRAFQMNDSWQYQKTDNPAWAYADVWCGSANRRPLDRETKLDGDALTSWAQFCSDNGYTYNASLDSSKSVLDQAREIAAAGRATWGISSDAQITVIQDVSTSTPEMIISPRNSYGMKYELMAIETPHALRVQFVDSTTWENSEVVVYDDGYNASNATLYESIPAPGVTDPEQAWKLGRYHLAQARLRPFKISYGQDIQNIRYNRGSLVTLNYDVIEVGIAAGRAKSVIEGSALHFGGAADYLSNSHIVAYDFTTAVTIEAWINWEGDTSETTKAIFSRNGPHLLWIDTANQRLFAGLLDNATSTYSWFYSATNSILPNTDYHVAFVWDGANVIFYIDGVQSGSTGSFAGPVGTTVSGIQIGWDAAGGGRYYFDGTIDEIRYWNVGRSAIDIGNNMNVLLAGTETGLAFYSRLNEGYGITAADLTSNTNDLTLNTSDGLLSIGPTWVAPLTPGDAGEPVTQIVSDEFIYMTESHRKP